MEPLALGGGKQQASAVGRGCTLCREEIAVGLFPLDRRVLIFPEEAKGGKAGRLKTWARGP